LLHGLNYIFPSDFLEEGILAVAFVLAGFGAHRLVQHAIKESKINLAAYAAGLFYMFNPFVYSRFMAGQYAVLLGYALLPFFVVSFLKFLDRPSFARALCVALWTTVIAIVSIHTVGPVLICALIFIGAIFWRRRHDKLWRFSVLKYVGLSVILAICMNIFWIIPAFQGHSVTLEGVSVFDQADRQAFATSPNGFGWLGNVLALQGFWADAKSLYLVPMDIFNWWWLPWLAVWALVIFGIYKSWQKDRGITAAFVALIIIAALLAIGTAGTWAAPFNQFLVDYVPFFAGYREPQKFVMLIALAYAYFGAVAVAGLADMARQKLHFRFAHVVVLPLFALPLLIAPLLPSFYGQLTPRQYPADWFEVNTYLQQTSPKAKTLFLPWHLYMPFGFAGRDIANPAPKFFKNPIIISNDPEMAGAKSYASTKDQQEVQTNVIPTLKHSTKSVAPSLRMLNIRYVILAKELDYKMYANMDVEDGIKLVRETETLKLYEVIPN
jgi:hypothetical protein